MRLGLELWRGILTFFGLGVVMVGMAILALIWVVAEKKYRLLARYWNIWLGCIAYALAAFGVLAFFAGEGVLRTASLGGEVGKIIIGGPPSAGGVLPVVALTLMGTFLVATRPFMTATVAVAFAAVKGFAYLFALGLRGLSGLVALAATRLQRQPAALPEEATAREPGRAATVPPAAPPEAPAARPGEEKEPAAKQKVAAAPDQFKQLRQQAVEFGKKFAQSAPVISPTGWLLPPIDVLDKAAEVELRPMDTEKRSKLIEEALASYGVEGKVVQINAGPTVTQFGVEPGWDRKFREIREKDADGNVKIRQEEVSKTRVKVERINALANDLSLALAASSIRIESPVPGKSMIGIEVPNATMGLVSLRGVIESPAFQKLKGKSKLALALGKGAGGEAVVADLARMPHLLIAGATGSGKTVCLNTIITCLLIQNTPDDVRFMMIDPKRVELVSFNNVPHLVTPVIVDNERAVEALRWMNKEMDNRYTRMAAAGARNIEAYNKNRPPETAMPYLILVIDELADLMMTAYDEVERIICRLAQLARATGIHLVVATQRPSVDVITGLIKANFPTRISFAVTSQVDSRTILDGVGAEKLLGRGDMLYLPTDAAKPKRLQGCYVSDGEIERVVGFWNNQPKKGVPSLKVEDLAPQQPGGPQIKGAPPEDPLLDEARALKEKHKNVSASFLQRKLQIGYPRAARLIDLLQQEETPAPGPPPAAGPSTP
ncbi:MAG: DNA translocase FtsK, partial [Chloroflexi bacterium]|nr:DNA translocase FtsK [Chloroflexota bacterium]